MARNTVMGHYQLMFLLVSLKTPFSSRKKENLVPIKTDQIKVYFGDFPIYTGV